MTSKLGGGNYYKGLVANFVSILMLKKILKIIRPISQNYSQNISDTFYGSRCIAGSDTVYGSRCIAGNSKIVDV